MWEECVGVLDKEEHVALCTVRVGGQEQFRCGKTGTSVVKQKHDTCGRTDS